VPVEGPFSREDDPDARMTSVHDLCPELSALSSSSRVTDAQRGTLWPGCRRIRGSRARRARPARHVSPAPPRSIFGQGGASRKVSKARSSRSSPRLINPPTVSQNVRIALTCANPSEPRGCAASNSARLSPSGRVTQKRLAARSASERYICRTVNRICPSTRSGASALNQMVRRRRE